MSSSKGLSQSWRDMYIDDYSFFAPIDNSEEEYMAAFMTSDAVQKALHVQQSPSKTWPYASQGFHYAKEYDACNWGNDVIIPKSMIDINREIVPLLDPTWVDNGDTDPCVSYEGTRTAVKRVGLKELDGGGYGSWFYNQTASTVEVLVEKPPLFGPNLLLQNMGLQFAGHVVNYEEGLAFVTIHGSGHMVPQFRPQAALHFWKCF
jgi:serine carboxypeptidase-like clade I